MNGERHQEASGKGTPQFSTRERVNLERVRLPREVAEAIESIRKSDMVDHALFDRKWLESDIDSSPVIDKAKDAIVKYIERKDDRWNEDNQLATYYRALVIGYEIIQTPEDKVRELYQMFLMASEDTNKEWYTCKMEAVNQTLQCLGIKISGVNA